MSKVRPTSARLHYERVTMDHLDGLSRMNSDPRVMTYIRGKPESRAETIAWIENCERRWNDQGCGWWVLREVATGELVGAATLQQLEENPDHDLEIGWRLHPSAWGKGYATEAGQAVVDLAFDRLGLDRLCAVAHPENKASLNVMERLGMRYVDRRRFYGADLAFYSLDRADRL